MDSEEAAQTLAQRIIAERLAACAQITAIESVYRWEGSMACEGEYRVSFKTSAGRLVPLRTALLAAHPYDLPQLLTIEAEATDAYAAWVKAECAAPAPSV